MQRDESYQKYQRFLTEMERKCADEMVGRTPEEKRALLQLTQRIAESFTDLYGDGGTKRTLLNDVRLLAMPSLSMN